MKKILLSVLILVSVNVIGQDRYFGQLYTSNVLGKGGLDIEVWHTSKFGHASGFYHQMAQRLEFEVGLGGRAQTAFYLNRFQTMSNNAAGDIETKNEIGFSNEWKFQLTKPAAKFGVGLYGELGIKGDELEWEGKFILDRAFGKNLFAFNLTAELEQEIEEENGKYKLELDATPVELALGYMRYVSPNAGLGIELRNNNTLEKGQWHNSVLFGGPTFNYRGGRWFVIVNYLPQWGNLHKTSYSPGKRELNSFEKNEARILLGFSF